MDEKQKNQAELRAALKMVIQNREQLHLVPMPFTDNCVRCSKQLLKHKEQYQLGSDRLFVCQECRANIKKFALQLQREIEQTEREIDRIRTVDNMLSQPMWRDKIYLLRMPVDSVCHRCGSMLREGKRQFKLGATDSYLCQQCEGLVRKARTSHDE